MKSIESYIPSFFKSFVASADLVSDVRKILIEHLQCKLSVSALLAEQFISTRGDIDKLITLVIANFDPDFDSDIDIYVRFLEHNYFEVIVLIVTMQESIEQKLADLEDKAPFVLTLVDNTLRESGPLTDYPELIVKFKQQLDSIKSMPVKARSGAVRLPVGPVPTTQEYEQEQQPAGKSFFSWR